MADDSGQEEQKERSFEQALERLEKLVTDMEEGSLSLEESMKRFEEGMKLVETCTAKLGEAEKRVEILTRKAGGEGEWTPLEEAEEESQ